MTTIPIEKVSDLSQDEAIRFFGTDDVNKNANISEIITTVTKFLLDKKAFEIGLINELTAISYAASTIENLSSISKKYSLWRDEVKLLEISFSNKVTKEGVLDSSLMDYAQSVGQIQFD